MREPRCWLKLHPGLTLLLEEEEDDDAQPHSR